MGSIRRTSAVLIALVALGVSACGADDDSSDAALDDTPSADAQVDEGRAGQSSDDAPSEATESGGNSTAGSSTPAAPLGLDELGRSIAVEAGVTIGTPDIREAVDETLDVVRLNNGAVYDADVDIGDEREDGSIEGSARIVVKVAPTDLDALIADLDGVNGTLTGRTQLAEDVTDQLVDLEVRIRVERNTIEQFERLLAEATTFQDVVDIQRVISERTVALEQLLASQRNIDQRVDMSTLTIDLHYVAPAAVVDEASDNSIAEAFSTGWEVFLGALFAIGFVVAVATPFLIVALLVGGLGWLIARRRRRSRPTAFVAPDPAARRQDEVADAAVGVHEGSSHAGVGDGPR
jgi:hypothetical protein